MSDYYNVMKIAKVFGYKKLLKLNPDEYKDILLNFSEYMKQFGVKQNDIKRKS